MIAARRCSGGASLVLATSLAARLTLNLSADEPGIAWVLVQVLALGGAAVATVVSASLVAGAILLFERDGIWEHPRFQPLFGHTCVLAGLTLLAAAAMIA